MTEVVGFVAGALTAFAFLPQVLKTWRTRSCADLSVMMLLLHFFTFDPAWVKQFAPARRDLLRYDGTCGLCHRAVRFVIAEDTIGAFRFAPLPSDVPQDSMIVETESGEQLRQSDAALYLGKRLGGLWRVIATIVGVIPKRIRDIAYDFIASIRYRLFARPKEACPMLPPDLRSRFDH